MEKLKFNFGQLNKALKTLEGGLSFEQEVAIMNDQEILLAAEDSTIRRFEYAYENFWRFLKQYLEQVSDLNDINSPQKIFDACVKSKVCTLQEGDIFIDMINSRVEASHSMERSRIILPLIATYYDAMIGLVNRLNDELGKSENLK